MSLRELTYFRRIHSDTTNIISFDVISYKMKIFIINVNIQK